LIVRVIAGSAGGVRLESPRGTEVRPTLDRVRESLFNILGESIRDAAVLDLFAGTGAIGIEALSRGASSAVAVDRSAGHSALIERNLAKTKLRDRGRVLQLSIPDQLGVIGEAFDLVYADPPRSFRDFERLAESIALAGLLVKSGRFVLETAASTVFDGPLGGLRPFDSRVYGHTRITIFA
jgi:16S rRNA (guanine966-N2)-methyltransferase